MKKGLGNLLTTTSSSHFFNKTDFKQYLLTITKNTCFKINWLVCRPEVESSRTHFEFLSLEGQVLGFGLEASSPRKLPCPRLEDSTFFLELLNFVDRLKTILEDVFTGESLKQNFEDLFFWRTLALVSLVLGLEHSCPWPRECLSSEELFLALDFFVSFAFASSLVSSTPPLV